MNKLITAAIVATAAACTGCASITDGTSQTLIFKLDPEAAKCNVSREGTELGAVTGKQNTIVVGKSARDIIATCTAEGYAQKSQRIVSSTQTAGVVGGVFLDLGITDMITGAMWKYPGEINVVLDKAK